MCAARTAILDLVFAEAVERFCTVREHEAAVRLDPRGQVVAVLRTGLSTGPCDELCCLLHEFPTGTPAAVGRVAAPGAVQQAGDLYVCVLTVGAAAGEHLFGYVALAAATFPLAL
ncbi:hypothetical protein [Streptomyces sp. OM5714]|uniref:hypothetical protein n=1 Tax=Streptomyces sp. OM5714 TaxID=2602736 RepID=UPI0013D95090|nr:hypothetical protein [Streptomyces sp. OM5714]KAF2776988.1 hypothetical protein STPH1_1647 [Streptomyces sp. OM5714]